MTAKSARWVVSVHSCAFVAGCERKAQGREEEGGEQVAGYQAVALQRRRRNFDARGVMRAWSPWVEFVGIVRSSSRSPDARHRGMPIWSLTFLLMTLVHACGVEMLIRGVGG